MSECLEDLDRTLAQVGSKLFMINSSLKDGLEDLLATPNRINQIVISADYTPFARKRQAALRIICERHNIPIKIVDNHCINYPDTTLKKDNTPYMIFTPWYNQAIKVVVDQPLTKTVNDYSFISVAEGQSILASLRYPIIQPEQLGQFYEFCPNLAVHGGRGPARQCLERFPSFGNYALTRDMVTKPTSMLSPHLKFGTVSPRETYAAMRIPSKSLSRTTPRFYSDEWIRQLFWRDFYMMLLFHNPHAMVGNLKSEMHVEWTPDPNEEALFQRWCNGQTGFPIVDAGMRHMNETGWMHNRVRMIAACFLVKGLLIDWRKGEKYFSNKLLDTDLANNNGAWQWVAGTSTECQPVFRFLNPWVQTKKFDPNCEYIKNWVPELREIPNNIILNWEILSLEGRTDYILPMIDNVGVRMKQYSNYIRR